MARIVCHGRSYTSLFSRLFLIIESLYGVVAAYVHLTLLVSLFHSNTQLGVSLVYSVEFLDMRRSLVRSGMEAFFAIQAVMNGPLFFWLTKFSQYARLQIKTIRVKDVQRLLWKNG